MRKIAISDIHGCILSLEALLDKIRLSTSDELYLLGDYIDRGPDSQKVIDKIWMLRQEGYAVRCLGGNHDFAILDARTDPVFFHQWYATWGGKQTMESFGVSSLDEIEKKYWDFFKSLELYIQTGPWILVHAGLDFSTSDPLKPNMEMVYIRDWHHKIDYNRLGDRFIVHGHTPVTVGQVQQMAAELNTRRAIDIDTGCFAKPLPGKGHLCAFDLTNGELFFQKCLDDVSSYWRR